MKYERIYEVTIAEAHDLLQNYFKLFIGHYLKEHTRLTEEEIERRYTDCSDCIPDNVFLRSMWACHFQMSEREVFSDWQMKFLNEFVEYKRNLVRQIVQDNELFEVTKI